MSGLAAIWVIWWTITSGRAAATASPTDAASRPSMTTPVAPSWSTWPSLAGLRVVPTKAAERQSHLLASPVARAAAGAAAGTVAVGGCLRSDVRLLHHM